jgi:hypothetical protein
VKKTKETAATKTKRGKKKTEEESGETGEPPKKRAKKEKKEKVVKEPKPKKKTKEEKEAEEDAIDPGYFYEEFESGEQEKAITAVNDFLEEHLKSEFGTNEVNEFVKLIRENKLHKPKRNLKLLKKTVSDKLK